MNKASSDLCVYGSPREAETGFGLKAYEAEALLKLDRPASSECLHGPCICQLEFQDGRKEVCKQNK